MRDLYSNLAFSVGIAAAANSADANGSNIDMQGYDSLMLIANVGVEGDTLGPSDDINLEVEHADDDGTGSPDTWSDVADADLLNSVTGANTGTFAHIDADAEIPAMFATGYIGGKRWVRVVVNVTGTHTNGTPLGITAIRGHAHNLPIN